MSFEYTSYIFTRRDFDGDFSTMLGETEIYLSDLADKGWRVADVTHLGDDRYMMLLERARSQNIAKTS